MAIVDDNFPPPRAGGPDDANFRYPHPPGHPLGPDAQQTMIGGTYRVSTRLDPQTCLTGGYQSINGDVMPAGAPVDGNPAYIGPYLPQN